MTASLNKIYNTFSDRESEPLYRTMTFAEHPNHPVLLTMIGSTACLEISHLVLSITFNRMNHIVWCYSCLKMLVNMGYTRGNFSYTCFSNSKEPDLILTSQSTANSSVMCRLVQNFTFTNLNFFFKYLMELSDSLVLYMKF